MNNKINYILALGVIALALSIIIKPSPEVTPVDESLQLTNQEEQSMPAPDKQYKQAEQVLEEGKSYSVTLTTTEGEITVELDTTNTPITANNFAFLAKDGFYDNTIFHRALAGFMIQGGDPTGTGTGSPGYRFADEYLEGEYKRGTIAMANSGPGTNGSQFFVMHADYALPNNYVIFGMVTEGLETVDAIAAAEVQPNSSGEPSSPVNPVSITSATLNVQ
jgi:cyclophilin family peptidyl-prolyl cis-trans isomerase